MNAARASTGHLGYRVGDLEIDVARRTVTRDGQTIPIGKLSYELLLTLVETAPIVLTREELIERVWGGRYVNPATIKQRIVLLRKALGDSAEAPRYVNAVRGHGYGLIPPVALLERRSKAHTDRWAPVSVSVLAAVAITAVWLAVFVLRSLSAATTVAVLPFANLSPDPEDAFFATGLHEEVINQLSELEGLQVISRASVQRFANATGVQSITQELGIDAIMEGTVRYTDNRVRISVQLTNPESSGVLWSATYERDFADIFEIQREIAMSVSGAFGVTLQVGGRNGFRGAGTDNIEAYEAYLQGLYSLRRPQGQPLAMSFFRQATRLDPNYAAAWAQLGFEMAATSWTASPGKTMEILDEAYPMVRRAAQLDPESARAASNLGTVQYAQLDWIGGAKNLLHAIDLSTSRYTLIQHANLLLRAGRTTAANSEFAAADSIERSTGRPPPLRVQVSIAEGNYGRARELAEAEPRAVLRDRVLLNVALNEGEPETIKGAMAAMIATQPVTGRLYSPVLRNFDSPERALHEIHAVHADGDLQWSAKQHDVSLVAAYFGDPQLALASISKEARLSTARHWALWYPVMSEARRLPAFKNLMADLNLVDYWRIYGWADACAPLGNMDFICD